MGLLDQINHLLNFMAPAVVVGAFLALFGPLLVSKRPEAQVFIVRVAINSIAGLLALGAGLWFFGHDGKMASYGAMVLASSAAQWAMSLRGKR